MIGIIMGEDHSTLRASLLSGIPDNLPNHPGHDDSVDHAPNRRQVLDDDGKRLAIKNQREFRLAWVSYLLGPTNKPAKSGAS